MTDEAAHLRSLLARYVEHVGDCEGVDFLDSGSMRLSDVELSEIIAINKEWRAAEGLPPAH